MRGDRRGFEEKSRPEKMTRMRTRIPTCVAASLDKHSAMQHTRPKPRSRTRDKRLTDRRWTFEELAVEVGETNKPMELWDGELFLSDASTFSHQEIVARFYERLKDWASLDPRSRGGDRRGVVSRPRRIPARGPVASGRSGALATVERLHRGRNGAVR